MLQNRDADLLLITQFRSEHKQKAAHEVSGSYFFSHNFFPN